MGLRFPAFFSAAMRSLGGSPDVPARWSARLAIRGGRV